MASTQNPPSPATPTPSTPSPADTTPFVLTLPDDPASGNDWYLWAGVLALIVMVAFFPAATGQFLWDDDNYASAPVMTQPDGLHDIWLTKDATRQWYPLTYTTFWLDNRLWHDNTLGYHLENLILHALSAILIWRLLRRLAIPLPWLCAALWAIHPLQAESVSWISERKNVLSGFLFFASLWFYVDYVDLVDPAVRTALRIKIKPIAYALSLLLFTLAMLAKTAVCALPVAIILLLWWKRKDLKNIKTWLGLAPFFLLGIALSCITVYLESAPGGTEQANGPDYLLSPITRLFIAGRGFWFYIAKLIWPVNLSFSYPRIAPGIFSGALFVLAAIAVIAACWIWQNKLGRGAFAAVMFYSATLFPSLGFINIYPMRYTFVADHYQYLSGLGLIILAVAAARKLFVWAGQSQSPSDTPATSSPWTAAIAGFILLILIAQAWLRANIYQSKMSLWLDTYRRNPSSWMACDNLGNEYMRQAISLEQDAQTNATTDVDTANQDLADATTDFQEAKKLFTHSIDLRPGNYVPHVGLGEIARHDAGQAQTQADHDRDLTQAESELAEAVRDEPSTLALQAVIPYVDYANVLAAAKHPEIEVRENFEKAVALSNEPRVQPQEIAAAELAYGRYLIQAAIDTPNLEAKNQDFADAATHLLRSLEKAPNQPDALYALGRVYRGLSEVAQDNANAAQKAGNFALADDYNQKVAQYDGEAMVAFERTIAAVPLGHHAGAVANAGELILKHVPDSTDEAQALNELGLAVQSFIEAESYDPRFNLLSDLKLASTELIAEGEKDLIHPTLWDPMKSTLQQILAASSGAGQSSLDSLTITAQSELQQILWPLPPQGHPLRDPLAAVNFAIQQYLVEKDTPKRPQAISALHDAVNAALSKWSQRLPATDDVLDGKIAVACFEQALKADNHSIPAYNDLTRATAILSAAAAKTPDDASLQDTVTLANQALGDYRAATQPSTQPTTAQ